MSRASLRRVVVALAACLPLALAAPAGAASRKVAIGDFRWSNPTVSVNLGEKVTWYWVGPDTQHSVTGNSPNSLQWDSDPGNSSPNHPLGHTFSLKFTAPGVYQFHCKLHAIVKGEVIVSATPGSDAPSPDPDPPLMLDVIPPELSAVRWERPRFHFGGGGYLDYTLDERSTVEVQFERLRKHKRPVLMGTRHYRGYIGYNDARFTGVLKLRHLRPGSYRALVQAHDADNNFSHTFRVPFTVAHPKHAKKHG